MLLLAQKEKIVNVSLGMKKVFVKIWDFVRRRKYVILVIIILGSAFYWYEWRPVQIRHDCSWKKVHHDFEPAKPGLTDLEKIDRIAACKAERAKDNQHMFLNIFTCEEIVGKNAEPVAEKPAWDKWVKTSDSEYKFCLRDRGL